MKLWKKNNTSVFHPLLEEYTVGTSDYLFDIHIFPYDVEASKAHASMLQKIGILTESECITLHEGLDILMKKWTDGEIVITAEDEDCHTVIENFLIEYAGDVGKKIHTGRSRNDQVLVASRLYAKAKLNEVLELGNMLVFEFKEQAKKYKTIPFPGYTHTQQAMLSSLGHYFMSHCESLQSDLEILESVIVHIDQNPLGSAAGYGVSIPLDRAMTTRLLGFRKTQVNSLWCQMSRGKFESFIMEGLSQIMATLGGYAQDMILFTSQEFNFFTADNSVVTGSSIMPQKRNLDGLEILRGNVSIVQAKHFEIKSLSSNLISGYHREKQLVKRPLIESFEIVHSSLEVVRIYLKNLHPHESEITQKITKEIFLADIANEMVQKDGVPFRQAYQSAFQNLDSYPIDFQKNIASKCSLGGPGNLGIDEE